MSELSLRMCRNRCSRRTLIPVTAIAGALMAGPLFLPRDLLADAIIITQAMKASTIAEVFISEGTIRVELEVGGRDLPGFRNLMPDGVYERMGYEPRPFAQRLEEFFNEDLVFRTEGGVPFRGRIVEIEPRKRVQRDEITGEPVPVPEGKGEDVVFAALEYGFEGWPATIAMRPPATAEGLSAASIGMMTYHEDLPVNDFRYFGTEEILDLDWKDPWYSKFRNRNLRRQYDSPVNAFLYVEPYEVRAEGGPVYLFLCGSRGTRDPAGRHAVRPADAHRRVSGRASESHD
jgi:hypothetical protein